MFELVPFKRDHLTMLAKQQINSFLPDLIKSGQDIELEKTLAFTGVVKGEIMVCGGIVHQWAGRGQLWSVFSADSKKNFISTFRGIQNFLNSAPYDRIEMAVPVHIEVGHRRAKMLGFEVECRRAKRYLPDGTDCVLYARVRE